jgi:ABC-2 type transport system ATP-binding protein
MRGAAVLNLDHSAARTDDALRAYALAHYYGAHRTLTDVTFRLPVGARALLVGANGSGKSTLFRIVLGIAQPAAGAIRVFGAQPGAATRAQTGYLANEAHLPYPWLTVRQHLRYEQSYFPTWDESYAGSLLDALAVDPSRSVRRLSRGEVRRLQLIAALSRGARLLLLDEPLAGLDPEARETVVGIIREYVTRYPSSTIMIATHFPEVFRRAADYTLRLVGGFVHVSEGTAAPDSRSSTQHMAGEGAAT